MQLLVLIQIFTIATFVANYGCRRQRERKMGIPCGVIRYGNSLLTQADVLIILGLTLMVYVGLHSYDLAGAQRLTL